LFFHRREGTKGKEEGGRKKDEGRGGNGKGQRFREGKDRRMKDEG